MAKLASNDRMQFLDSNGDPYSGAQLFTYEAGSTTKAATYSDSGSTSANTNPIILDSQGFTPNQVYLTEGQSYKFVLAPSGDTDPPASPIITDDNITGINDTGSITIEQWVSSGLTPTFVSATQFTLSGDQTTEFHVDRRLKTTNGGGTIYSTISSSSYSAPNTTVTVSNDSGSLDSGLSAVSYGILSKTNDSLPENIVATDKVADNAITLAKMAGGTAGHTITYDSSGDPQTETYMKWVKWGDSGQLTSGSSYAFTDLPASATKIEIVGLGINITTSDQIMSLVAGYGATPTYITASGDYIGTTISLNEASSARSAWSTYSYITTARTGNTDNSFKVTMDKINDGSDTWAISISGISDPGAAEQLILGFGRIKAASLTTALTAVKIELAANAFSDGYITAYYYGNADV